MHKQFRNNAETYGFNAVFHVILISICKSIQFNYD